MGGVINGALGTASNLVGGLPIVGGMARSAIGQAGGMLGQPQQGQPQGGMAGGKGGGQGGLGGLFGGMAGGKGGGPMQAAANFANQSYGSHGQGNPMWSMQNVRQQVNPGGQYGGGYAANGRSLMPTGQQAQGTGATGMTPTNNGQSANSTLDSRVWGGPGSPGW